MQFSVVIFLTVSLCALNRVPLALQRVTLPMLHQSPEGAGQIALRYEHYVHRDIPYQDGDSQLSGSAEGGRHDYETGDSQFTRSPG
jgi:hypothetical protein